MFHLPTILLVPILIHNGICESTLDDKYYLGKNWYSYSQAIRICDSLGMKLVSIENSAKNDELSELMRQKEIRGGCWVSGRTLPDRRSWSWLDGKPVIYQNWNPFRNYRYDHALTDNCITVARYQNQLYWDDQLCQNLRCFICEYPKSDCKQHRISIRVDDHLNGTNTAARTARRKEFFVSKSRATYQQATDSCQSMSMELISIYNEEENDEIDRLLAQESASRFWTSGHRESAQGIWHWSRGENITYRNWRSGEPNNARRNEFCILVIRLNEGVRWMDQTCNDLFRYICQSIVPKVDIVVNGDEVVYQGQSNVTTRVPSQERPFQVFVDVESGPTVDKRDQVVWNHFISDEKVRQSVAVEACKNRSQHLLTIEDSEKNELIFDSLEKSQVRGVFWTSASINTTNSRWQWGNGEPVTYFHWGVRSKSNTTKGAVCMEIHKTDMDVTWSELPCDETRQYICEDVYVYSVNAAGGTVLSVSYDNDLVYKNDSTVIVTRK